MDPVGERAQDGGARTQTALVTRNAAVRVASELLGKVATLVLTVVGARTLGESGFGTFSFALAFSLLLATVPVWGFGTLLVQRASADPRLLDRLYTQTLVLNAVLALPVYLVVGGLVALTRPTREATLSVVLLLLASLVDVGTDSARSASAAAQRQAGTATALVVQRTVVAALAVAVLALGGGVVGMSAAYLAGTVVGGAFFVVAVRRLGVRLDGSALTRTEVRATVVASLPVGADSVVSMALFRLDAVLLGLLASVAAVGHYAAAYRFLETVLFLAWTVTGAVFPAMSSDPAPWRVRRGLEQGLAVLATAYVPFAVLLLVRPADLLRLLYAGDFVAPGTPVVRLLALAPLAFALEYLCSFALLALVERRLVLLSSAGAALVNLGANLALIPLLGARGAALTTTLSYLLEAIVLARWLAPRVELKARPLVLALAVPAAASVPLLGVLLLPLPVLLAAALGGVVYAAGWLVLSRQANPELVGALSGLVRR